MVSYARRQSRWVMRKFSSPAGQNILRIGRLDLLAIATMVEGDERVVTGIGRAAHSISYQDYPISNIDRAQYGGQNAHIRF